VPENKGRLVMLVDNAVEGDSRVQKAAESAAQAGWDVVLLGKSLDTHEHTWMIGDAKVRLLPVEQPLAKRRHEFRRRLRAPLAYPPNGIAPVRHQAIRAWKADIAMRRAEIRRTPGVSGHKAELTMLQLQSVAAKVIGKWVGLRYRQLNWAKKRRAPLSEPWDRWYTAFWLKMMGNRAWRRLEPGLWDLELAYGPVIDKLAPDVIHSHDFRMLGVGARAAVRAKAKGRTLKLLWDVHEYVPGVRPWRDNERWLPAHVAYEREYARYADAVVTVSPTLAEMLQRDHKLAVLPRVVLNAPTVDRFLTMPTDSKRIRLQCGIDVDVPLLVYSGAAAPQRGLDIMIEALPRLPDTHVALVVGSPGSEYVKSLVARAEELGVQDRLHLPAYVPYDEVVELLSGADIGVIPIHHHPNHEIALITKFFEYSHARLPLVVSDVKTMAQTTIETGQGEVFRAEDLDDYVRAVSAVLAAPERYRAAYEQPGLLDGWTWEQQAATLDELYTKLTTAE
jgi:glycosyltransferase involved in cell wall biosynthesis